MIPFLSPPARHSIFFFYNYKVLKKGKVARALPFLLRSSHGIESILAYHAQIILLLPARFKFVSHE
jgi:hypothetical protein